MNFYASDLHFGHINVIPLCGRPFESVDEMDERMIEAWNKTVHRNDRVYIVGDFIFRATRPPEYYLDRLKGEKYLIVGNHDESWMKKMDKTAMEKYFKEVSRMTFVNTGKGKATLCHFPMLDFEGRYLIHGHIHNKACKLEYWDFLKNADNVFNAGVDINGFKPVEFDELVENNIRFKLEH